MKTKVILIIGIVLLLSFISALNITAGDTHTFSVGTTNKLFFDVVNNQSNMNGLEVHQEVFSNYSNITIETKYWFAPDNFTLIFFGIKTEVKIVSSGGGSGGSSRVIERKIIEYTEIPIDKEVEIIIEVENKEEIEELERKIKRQRYAFMILLVLLIFYFSLLNRRTIKIERKGGKSERRNKKRILL